MALKRYSEFVEELETKLDGQKKEVEVRTTGGQIDVNEVLDAPKLGKNDTKTGENAYNNKTLIP